MERNAIIVVGDRFTEFARNSEVQRISYFLNALRHSDGIFPPIVLAQGLSKATLEELRVLISNRTGENSLNVHIPVRATCKLTHKHVEKNIMISMPTAKSDKIFEAELLLDDCSDVIEDHQTGQHIQGIALIEAARQFFTAATEKYLIPPNTKGRFIFDSIQTTFHRFVFPLPCSMIMNVLKASGNSLQRIFVVEILLFQNNENTTTIETQYRVIDSRVCEKQEAIAACHALQATIANVTSSQLAPAD